MKYLIVCLMFIPSLLVAGFTNSEGKWEESGQGVGTVKGYILVEPSAEYKAKLEAQRIAREIEEAKPKPKTELELLKERIEILENKVK